jgi:hypothetical protein
VSDSHEERIAKNQTVFRDVNERIEAGELPAEAAKPVAFCCECARLGCNVLIEVPIASYERVRAHPRHFILATGHENGEVETVIKHADGYVVVEKVGEAGAVAQATDPRS